MMEARVADFWRAADLDDALVQTGDRFRLNDVVTAELRRVLVTGANRGFGAACVTEIAAAGWEVFAAWPRLSGLLTYLQADAIGRESTPTFARR